MIRTAAKFAAFAALTVGLTAFIGAQIAKIQLGDTYRLSATFDDVTGPVDYGSSRRLNRPYAA